MNKKELILDEIRVLIDVRTDTPTTCRILNQYFAETTTDEAQKKVVYPNSDKDLIAAFNNELEMYLLSKSDIDDGDKFVVMTGNLGKSAYDWSDIVDENILTEYIYNHWADYDLYFPSLDIDDPYWEEEAD